MVVVDALHGDSAAATADELFGGGTGYSDLQAFLDHMAPEVKASGCGSDGEEELEWLSNKDAFPTVETMGSPWVRPAKSPTFSSGLHSNRHHRIAELRRRRGEAVQTSLAAAGCGKEAGQELERLSNRSVFLAADTTAPAGQRPRTKGLQRPRGVLAWSPPPPPRTLAQGRVPGGGADGGRAAATAGGGLGGDVAADEGRVLGQRLNQPGGGAMALDSCTAGGGAADKGRAAAAAAPSGGVVDHAARAAAAALRTPAQRRCQHCGTETTPQWRKGPDGKPTLCNACGLWYKKSGGLVPEYRPASCPNFSPTLHSSRRDVIQRRRASTVVTAAIAAAIDEDDK